MWEGILETNEDLDRVLDHDNMGGRSRKYLHGQRFLGQCRGAFDNGAMGWKKSGRKTQLKPDEGVTLFSNTLVLQFFM